MLMGVETKDGQEQTATKNNLKSSWCSKHRWFNCIVCRVMSLLGFFSLLTVWHYYIPKIYHAYTHNQHSTHDKRTVFTLRLITVKHEVKWFDPQNKLGILASCQTRERLETGRTLNGDSNRKRYKKLRKKKNRSWTNKVTKSQNEN